MTDYFELLTLPPVFDLSLSDLEAHFHEQAARFHPDRFAHKNAFEKKQYTRLFATLNDAYQTLKNPIKRAEYFLNLNNITYDPETILTHDTDWLEKQLEYREKIDEAKTAADLESLTEQTKNELVAVFRKIAAAIASREWQEVIIKVQQAKYWHNLEESLTVKQASLTK